MLFWKLTKSLENQNHITALGKFLKMFTILVYYIILPGYLKLLVEYQSAAIFTALAGPSCPATTLALLELRPHRNVGFFNLPIANILVRRDPKHLVLELPGENIYKSGV